MYDTHIKVAVSLRFHILFTSYCLLEGFLLWHVTILLLKTQKVKGPSIHCTITHSVLTVIKICQNLCIKVNTELYITSAVQWSSTGRLLLTTPLFEPYLSLIKRMYSLTILLWF